ncbi:MAG: PKD domain-containing protein [Bacteroidota bacterium]
MNKHNKISNLKSQVSNLLVFLLCITLFSQVIFAQSSSCPNLTVGPNASLCSGCTSISATLQGTKATTSYSVSSVPYTPFSFNTGTSVLLGIDDTWSSAITIPFCFSFFGNTYTQCVIGSNVLLSFDVANAGDYNTWPISAAVPSATPADLTNCIMGPWHDIDPSVSSSSTPIINWKVQGTAPCRSFVVSWTDISMYSSSCNSQLATSQIVLYETTNNIEIYIKDKPLCTGWNSGAAIEGIQNSSGTQAVVVPGRNYPTQWSATNDGQRFTPTGAPQYTFTWYAPGNVAIGTTPTLSVCPITTTTYTATIVNSTCNGPITFSSPVTVTVTPPPCTGVSCSFSVMGDTVCAGGTISLTASTVTNATYQWTGPNGYTSTFQNPTITNGTLARTGWYIVKDTIPGCSYTDSVFVLVIPPPTVNAGPDQTICNGTLTLAGSIGGSATSGTWTGGAGTYTPNNTTLNCTYTLSSFEISSGSVTLTLTTDDPPGSCTSANDQMQITFNSVSSISAGPDQSICVGNSVTLSGSISGSGTASWSGGSGSYSPDNTSATAVYTPSVAEATAGSVSLSFSTGTGGSCPGANDIMVITITQIPTANAGSTQFICAGLGITLSGSIGGSATIGTWSGGNGTYSPDNTTLNAVYTASPAEFAIGTVTLTLTTDDPAGSCSFSSSNVNFKFYQNPVVDFSIDNSTGCPILCSNFTDATIAGVGYTIAGWSWNFGDGGTGSAVQNPSHCFSTSGYYDITLSATTSDGCVSSLVKSNFVQVFNVPAAEFTTTPDPASLLDPAINFNDQSSSDVNYWSWDFGDSTTLAPSTSDPIHGYPNQVPGTYLATLIVHNSDGCYDTVAHQIVIGPAFTFFMPTAFSPNSNGINDHFFGSGIGIIKYDMLIFDRWGDMIFHGKDLSEKWNGKANKGGDDSQIDVYVWKVELTDVFNKKHSFIGTVTLVK